MALSFAPGLDPPRPTSLKTSSTMIVAGVRSAFTYAGASTLDEFRERATVGVQSMAGFHEGQPLHASW